ncbi:unnamed protein product [Allacma fusca]|uniref:Uncharacterized protein n=1 Tax=Allacma fusca TaxID=39272 RepID=A0A8J2KEC3_9HEXA|nr:unnamed protein product [Allacma fusca]
MCFADGTWQLNGKTFSNLGCRESLQLFFSLTTLDKKEDSGSSKHDTELVGAASSHNTGEINSKSPVTQPDLSCNLQFRIQNACDSGGVVQVKLPHKK